MTSASPGWGCRPERKESFKTVMLELTQLQAKFEENVLDATNALELARRATAPSSRGLNEMLIEQARRRAAERGLPGWVLSLDQPTYVAVVTDAESEVLRRAFYEAWTTRASDQGPNAGRWDNSAPWRRSCSAGTRRRGCWIFATTPSTRSLRAWRPASRRCCEFLHELAGAARAAAQAEFAELEAFAGRKLAAWDVGFYAERLQRQRFSVSQEELRPYFPLPRVLAGLFEVAERLFGVRIRERPAPRCGTPTCAASTSRTAGARRSAASTWTPTRAPTSAAARGWTSAWGASASPAARRFRSPTWCAIFCRPAASSPRCSRTMTC